MMEGDGNVCSNPDPEVRCHSKFIVASDIIVKRLDKIVIVLNSQPQKKQVFVECVWPSAGFTCVSGNSTSKELCLKG